MTLSYDDILSLLPHRPPMLLVDEILELVPGQSASGKVYINPEWNIFAGHFPGQPVLPGIYMTEILAQTAGILLLSVPAYRGSLPMLFEVNHMRFLHPVYPDDTLRMEASLKLSSEPMHVCRVKAYVNDRCAAKGELTLALRPQAPSSTA